MNTAEITNFVGGLVTDSNPMSFPDNASLYEQNMLINQDGTRSRRLGFDFEYGYQFINSGVQVTSDTVYKTFRWEGVSGVPDLTFVVVTIGRMLFIFPTHDESLSASGYIYTCDLGVNPRQVSMSSVDGILVVAFGGKDLLSIEFDKNSGSFTNKSFRLLVRDTFSVEDIYQGKNLYEGLNIQIRPLTLTDAHAYNLRNQTFAKRRMSGSKFQYSGVVGLIEDPLKTWSEFPVKKFPSNADSVLDALYPDSASEVDPLTNRFHVQELQANAAGTIPAPVGYFIIDALDRGKSRMEGINTIYESGALVAKYKPKKLPQDSTPSGATCLAQFAGRMFYAGFSSEVIDGDSHSPRMGSYVLFSQLVQTQEDLKACYQIGDPTSKNFGDLLATDGGFIKVDGAYDIFGMVPMASGLVVIARNGIWLISGEDKGQFKATSFTTSKLSQNGCDSPSSIVSTGDGLFFWSNDGIYKCSANQFGDLGVTNITRGVIQTFYDKIDKDSKKLCYGVLDRYERKIKWLYNTKFTSESIATELVYNLDFGAFTHNIINRITYEVDDPG